MKKPFFKSKTINSTLVVAMIAIMSLLGIGETDIAKSYDMVPESSKSEDVKELITLIAASGAIYGRFKVKEKDDADD
jgi:hypothetical protein